MLLAIIAVFMALSLAAAFVLRPPGRRRTAARPPTACQLAYVPFIEAGAAEALVVDCTHPSAPTFTHHKGSNNPPGLPPSDTSTGLVLNALRCRRDVPGVDRWLTRSAVAVNHFDGDALFSVWSLINPEHGLRHEDLLRRAAALHDFREALLGTAAGHAALALCCWINTIERTRFSPPYEDKDADEKFEFFLRELGPFLEAPQAYEAQWRHEYAAVLREWESLRGCVTVYEDVGLAVVRAPAAVHYYSLFSHSLGCDSVVSSTWAGLSGFRVLRGWFTGDASWRSRPPSCPHPAHPSLAAAQLALYEGQRYELEGKYTQFVAVHSRPVHGRLEMGPLAAGFNRFDPGRAPGTSWATPSMLDTGPLLRLDTGPQKLAKRQRYGHPTERPIHRSGLSPGQVEAAVVGYLRHGLRGAPPRVGGWSWDDLLELNAGVDWAAWEAALPGVLAAAAS